MIRIDFLLVILILQLWTPGVVTDENGRDLMTSAQEFYASSGQAQQREALLYPWQKQSRRILYLGSESINRDNTVLFRPQKPNGNSNDPANPVRSRPLNIFGHYQHHQEVLPSFTAASDHSSTRFRPSPLDPLPSFDDEPSEPEQFQRLYPIDSERGGNNDERFGYETEEQRHPQNDARNTFLELEEQNDRGTVRHRQDPPPERQFQNEENLQPQFRNNAHFPLQFQEERLSPRQFEDEGNFQPQFQNERHGPRQFQNGGHFPRQFQEERNFQPQFRNEGQPSREGLISQLYQSYLSSLANNRFRPSVMPNVEVNPRSNRKPEKEVKSQRDEEEEDVNINRLTPLIHPTVLSVNEEPIRGEDHYVVPIQQEILPSPESLRQNRRYPSYDHIFQHYARNPTIIPERRPAIIQLETPITTTPPPRKIIRINKGLLRTYNHEIATTISPTTTTVPAPQSFPALRRETIPTRNLQRIYKPNPPQKVRETTTTTSLPITLVTKKAPAPAQFEEHLGDDYVGLRDAPKYEIRAPPPIPPQLTSTGIDRLPEFYPFAFRDGPRLQNFLEPGRGKLPISKPPPIFEKEAKVTPRDKPVSKKPKIGKLLYSQKKAMAKAGGVYAGFQILPEYHAYGVPVNAQFTPIFRMKTSVVRSEPRVTGTSRRSDTGNRRQSPKSPISAPNQNQLVPRTVSKNVGNLKPNNIRRQPKVVFTATALRIQSDEDGPTVSTPTIPILKASTTNQAIEIEVTLPPPKVTPAVSLRKPAGIRKLIARPRPNSFPKEHGKEEQISRKPKSESSPKVVIKKVRTRKPGVGTIVQKAEASEAEVHTQKPTEFPFKYSSRYRNETQQIPPTSIPTASVSIESKEEQPTPKRAFQSKPRRLVTKVPAKTQFSELPESVLLSPKDVILNRKPARRIPAGSVSERLKSLKVTPSPDSAPSETRRNSGNVSQAKRGIVSVDTSKEATNNNGRRLGGSDKVKSSPTEFDSSEMREILGIVKPINQIGTNTAKKLPGTPIRTDVEPIEDDFDDYEEEKEKQESKEESFFPESSSHWSFPIISNPGNKSISFQSNKDVV